MEGEAERVAKSSRVCCVLPSFLTDSCTYVPSAAESSGAGVRVVTDGQGEPAPPPTGKAQVIGQPALPMRQPSNGGQGNEDLSAFLKTAIAERQGAPAGAAAADAQKPRASPRTSPARGRSNSPHRPRSPRSVNIAMLVGELRTEAARLVGEGHPEAADLVYREALRYNPNDHVLKAAQIESVLLQGRVQEALVDAQALTAQAPNVAKGWQVEAAALEKLGQLRAAYERYQRGASVAAKTAGGDPAIAQQCLTAAEALLLKMGPL